MNKKQASVFLLVLALGIVSAFFVFKYLRKESEPLLVDENGNTRQIDPPAPGTSPDPPVAPATANTPTTPDSTPPTTDTEASAAAKIDDLFRDPEKLMGALADLVKARDTEAFIDMVGKEAISPRDRKALVELLKNPAYAPAATDPVISLARFDDITRWAIQLDPVAMPEAAPGSKPAVTAPADGSATPATGAGGGSANTAAAGRLPSRQIYIDISEGEDKVWKIEKVQVPQPVGDGSTGVLPPSADSITVAHAFSRAVLGGDFKTARAYVDPDKVTDERIAALMIALEEGAYRLQRDRPLVQTLSRDTVSWIIARLQNADSASEFGLEMARLDPKLGWRIDNMSFDKIIQMTATAAGGGNVAYAPIVKNPQGGDSLVVFFEFDSADLNVRSERQVRMIADILKENPEHQIKINGHADALGLDQYNRALSARRAQTVKGALISLGVSSDQIVAIGLGTSVPLSPNFKPDGSDNPSGRSQNRRSEIYLDF